MNRTDVIQTLHDTISLLEASTMKSAMAEDVAKMRKLLERQLSTEEIDELDVEYLIDSLNEGVVMLVLKAMDAYEKNTRQLKGIKWSSSKGEDYFQYDGLGSVLLEYPELGYYRAPIAKTMDKAQSMQIKEVTKAVKRQSDARTADVVGRTLQSMGALKSTSIALEEAVKDESEPHANMQEASKDAFWQVADHTPDYDDEEYNELPFQWHANENVEAARRFDPKKFDILYTFFFSPELKMD